MIKLTEDDFDWWVGCDKSDQYTLCVNEIGKQQILSNQEKAEKHDRLEKQNKQLKEIIAKIEDTALLWDGKESQHYGNKIMSAIHRGWGKTKEGEC